MFSLKELCLELTNRCNLNCMHCSTEAEENPKQLNELSLDEVIPIISDLSKLGGEILEISGGEPTLHPELPEIISYAKDKDLEVRLYSNGTNKQNGCNAISETYLKRLFQEGLDKIVFNLQAPNWEIQEKITGNNGSFNATIESIKLAKKVGFWVGIHFVPMKPNAKKIESMLDLANSLDVDEVALLRFVPQGRGEINITDLKLEREELWEFLGSVAKLNKKSSQRLKIRTGCPLDFLSFVDETVQPSSCKVGFSTCNITPSGDVIPCPAFKKMTDYIAGNIKENSLKSIWDTSKVFIKLRELSEEKIMNCSECSRIDQCKGRCVAQRVREYGNPAVGPDPDCRGPYEKKATHIRSYFYNQEFLSNVSPNQHL